MRLSCEDDVSGSPSGFILTGLCRVRGIHTVQLHAFDTTTMTRESYIETFSKAKESSLED